MRSRDRSARRRSHPSATAPGRSDDAADGDAGVATGRPRPASRSADSANAAHDEISHVAQSVALGPHGQSIERTYCRGVESERALARTFGTARPADLVEKLADVGAVLRRRDNPSG